MLGAHDVIGTRRQMISTHGFNFMPARPPARPFARPKQNGEVFEVDFREFASKRCPDGDRRANQPPLDPKVALTEEEMIEHLDEAGREAIEAQARHLPSIFWVVECSSSRRSPVASPRLSCPPPFHA